MGEEVRPGQWRRGRADRLLPARRHRLRPDHQEDPGRQARPRDVGPGRRGAHLVLPPVGGGGHEQADPARLDDLRQRDRHHLARGAQRLHRGLRLPRRHRHAGQQEVRRDRARQVQDPAHDRARHHDLSRRLSVGERRQEGGQHRPHEGDRGARAERVVRRPGRQDDHRPADAPHHPRRLYRRGQGQEVQRAREVLAAEAGRHAGGLRPQEESRTRTSSTSSTSRPDRLSGPVGRPLVRTVSRRGA